MEAIIGEVVTETPRVLERVAASLPEEFPGKLFDQTTKGLLTAAKQLGARAL